MERRYTDWSIRDIKPLAEARQNAICQNYQNKTEAGAGQGGLCGCNKKGNAEGAGGGEKRMKSVKSNKKWQKDAVLICSQDMHSKNNRLKSQETQSRWIPGKDIGWCDIHKNPRFYADMHIKWINMHKCMAARGQYAWSAICKNQVGRKGQN